LLPERLEAILTVSGAHVVLCQSFWLSPMISDFGIGAVLSKDEVGA